MLTSLPVPNISSMLIGNYYGILLIKMLNATPDLFYLCQINIYVAAKRTRHKFVRKDFLSIYQLFLSNIYVPN